ncbi:MAG: ABC transporter permease [Chloroflexi bacterium]|nr:ABC transporter permease [Chloroflexota bacterium]
MQYILDHPDRIFDFATEHVYITVVTILIASLVGVILGVLVTRLRFLYEPVLTMAGVIYTIPSLAMFVLMIPLLGIGFKSAVAALVLYSLLIIIRNTAVGIDSVDPNIIEAARGMGMTSLGILFRIEIPLALPVVFAGIRIAAVSAISLATIAAFIGAGGLGDLIFEGLSAADRYDKIIAGAVVASAMALAVEVLLRQVQQGVSPGVTGDFKSLGERLADYWDHLRENPDTVVMLGALLLLLGYFSGTWVKPYSYDERIAENADNQALLDEAGLLDMSGFDLTEVESDQPIQQSLRLLPWFGILAGLLAIYNTLRGPGNRASAELLLLCGLLALFPLAHFHFETRRAVGELDKFSFFFRSLANEFRAAGVNVSLRITEVETESGFRTSIYGALLMVLGAYLKSLWFRRHAHDTDEHEHEEQEV